MGEKKNDKWNEEKIREELLKAGEMESIPRSLKPEEIRGKLNQDKIKKKSCRWWYTTAVAACLVLVIFAMQIPDEKSRKTNQNTKTEEVQEGSTYKDIYEAFSKIWEEENTYETIDEDVVYDMVAEGQESRTDFTIEGALISQYGSSAKESSTDSTDIKKDYGKTNQQEAEVEEADIIKNDGRYLYQIIQSNGDDKYSVQITDTKNGLAEEVRIGEFDGIHNIYVTKNQLIILEAGWAENAFTKIHVYDITNRAKPKEYHTFTIKGEYQDSRISDGYLYYFAQVYTEKTEDPEDYASYLPMLNDEPIAEKDIYLPNVLKTDTYLVMTSIDLEKPDKFTDTKAIVTNADQFYVSQKNIYVTDILPEKEDETKKNSNRTKIYRFSYNSGKIKKEAEGEVKGILLDDMAMNEYQNYLRLVTTVDSYETEEVIDDITGESIGYQTLEHETSNSLYILKKDLTISGKIENLAEGEEVYSARFMNETGYFVTFRQMDPLFSVDLSDPKEPKILGKLKINGFSEYLHFYSKDLLLGIGMEADEEGVTQGMKISMFDISDPSNVTEKSKMNLSEYDSSPVLYDYKAVLIDTDKNLFGFLARSYRENEVCSYLLFSYEDGEFKQKMNIDCSDYEIYEKEIRGTYIGESFYLMCSSGRIEEYSLKDGSKLDELKSI